MNTDEPHTMPKQTTEHEIEISKLYTAIRDSRQLPVAFPVLAKYGYMERTPNGFKSIDPATATRRCKELITELSA